jgi:ABC-type antimicrobial peptide transport system permease subunit
LLLAVIGIYGVISYSVTQRTREFGIRFAVGAQRMQVVGMVLRQGLYAAGIGVAVGLLAALAVTRVLKNMLYDVSATDPLIFACITGLLIAVALIASVVPAVRAMRVDPMVALRSD